MILTLWIMMNFVFCFVSIKILDELNSEIETIPSTNAVLWFGRQKKRFSKLNLRYFYSATIGPRLA
jgi:hypothetical protein